MEGRTLSRSKGRKVEGAGARWYRGSFRCFDPSTGSGTELRTAQAQRTWGWEGEDIEAFPVVSFTAESEVGEEPEWRAMEPEHLLQIATGLIPFDVDDVDCH